MDAQWTLVHFKPAPVRTEGAFLPNSTDSSQANSSTGEIPLDPFFNGGIGLLLNGELMQRTEGAPTHLNSAIFMLYIALFTAASTAASTAAMRAACAGSLA